MPKQKSSSVSSETNAEQLPVAVQLYTLRNLKLSPDALFAEVAAAGYDGVELAGTYELSASDFRSQLDANGLRAASAHIPLTELESDLPGAIRYHKILGNDTLVVPSIPEPLRGKTTEAWKALGRRLAELGRRCSYANMRLLYHNHDFEMVMIDGRLAIDWLLDEAQAGNVGFEMDIAWVTAGGQDVVSMLARYAGRCPRVHVKDLGDNAEERGFADVGHGRLDWNVILPAIRAAGAEWLVVEHDQPIDGRASIRRSYEFLSSHQ